MASVGFFKKTDILAEIPRAAIIYGKRIKVFISPTNIVIDQDFVNRLSEIMQNRNRQPLPAVFSANPVPVLPFVFFKLDIV